MHLSRLLALGGLLLAAPLHAAPPPELPAATFVASPEISQLRFSPNGRYLAALVPVERRLNLVVMDLEAKTQQLVTKFADEGIIDYRWANDERLLFRRDEGGRENFGLYAVNRTGGVVDRLAYRGEQAGTAGINTRFSGLLRRDAKERHKFLVLVNQTVRDRPDVAVMDVRSGVTKVITPNPGMVIRWILDWDNVARIGIEALDDGLIRILYRDSARQPWEVLHQFTEGEPAWYPLEFDGDNRTLYVASDLGRATVAVHRYDTATRTMGELVHGDDTYDVVSERYGALVRSDSLRQVVGVRYHAEKLRSVYWEPGYARRQAIIDRSLPGFANQQIEASEDGSRIVIFSSSDREPGVYYLFDEKNKRIEQLAVTMPRIDPEQMAEMRPVSFPARDGLTIHAYLTLPAGREPRGLPLIVNPHGGPYGIRDTWGFNREIQFLANRGFAVLQVNYRGSGGYGRAFEQAGYQRWGLEMQDDLTDGVKWAIAEGYADPARVVIYGASYGGYATMAGLTFTPELYCAGINYVGVTDLVRQWGDLRGIPLRQLHWIRTRIGDVNSGEVLRRLEETSPARFADRVRAPVLMAYGRNDPRVRIEQGYIMEEALKRAGKQFEFIVESDEGHGFRKDEVSVPWYETMEGFLRRHVPGLAGRVQTGTPEVLEMRASEPGAE